LLGIRRARPLSAVGEYWSARSGRRMMERMIEGRTFLYAACFALAVLGAARTNPGNRGSSAQARTAAPSGAAIAVGSFDFPKSALGTRELVDQALINGLIQLVPKYAGSALDFMSRGRSARALIPGGQGVH
jgi:hypothetical protein